MSESIRPVEVQAQSSHRSFSPPNHDRCHQFCETVGVADSSGTSPGAHRNALLTSSKGQEATTWPHLQLTNLATAPPTAI